jgi:hypothetical protein
MTDAARAWTTVLKWLFGAWLAFVAAVLVIMTMGFVVANIWRATKWWLSVLD